MLVALIAAAIVAVLLPTCAMQLCTPEGSMMGMDLRSLDDCPYMHFPSDAPAGVEVPVFMLLIALAAIALVAERRDQLPVSAMRFESVEPDDPDPPDDPLVGRLRL